MKDNGTISRKSVNHKPQIKYLVLKVSRTALLLACELNHETTAIILIENGANIEASDYVSEWDGKKEEHIRTCS